eukprot:TRINITY_DN10038_c0_g1_i2.p1 TRINITY_DN10038_c0_g1~~TRINITY_DN10038_c0_g1_i2.p1  ORF type:complete len:234 (-),score=61.27 TRINITY_DN10038_c0_g1_i2:254-955(-)
MCIRDSPKAPKVADATISSKPAPSIQKPSPAKTDSKPASSIQKPSPKPRATAPAAPPVAAALPRKTAPAAMPKPPAKPPAPAASSQGAGRGLPEHTVTTLSEAGKYVLAYMQAQNRPFNAQIIADNMRGKIRKALVENALVKLTEDGSVTEKLFGKAKVFWANQDRFETVSAEQLSELKKSLQASSTELKEASGRVQQLSSSVQHTSMELTEEQLDARLEELEQQVSGSVQSP